MKHGFIKRCLFIQSDPNNKIQVMVKKGSPQGGVLSPLLWNMMVDSLLPKLNEEGFCTYGYADDISIVLNGTSMWQLCNKMQNALDITSNWCQRNSLNLNSDKTILIAFTHKRRLGNCTLSSLGKETLELHNEVKYLRVIIDKKLSYRK